MWARVSRYQFPPGEADDAVVEFERAIARFHGQPGLVRTEIFVNRATGAGLSVTIWESREALKASDEAADDLRDEIALYLTGWIESVDEYELALDRPA